MNLMEIQLGSAKPGVDKTNHLLVTLYALELVHGVFKEDIGRIDAVGLGHWEALIVLFENLENVHEELIYRVNLQSVGFVNEV